MKKRWRIFLILIVGLTVVYFLGPKAEIPVYSEELPQVVDIDKIESFILEREAIHEIRPGNEANIVWADSAGIPTEYVMLYLHGFSASHKEGDPVHQNLARHFGANLYLSRLSEHGLISENNLENYTADGVWESSKEALVIASKLGKKVIIISTSTGSPLALKLAASYPQMVHALVNLSPNIRVKDPTARLLNDPWGEQIANMVIGEQRHVVYENEEAKLYWDTLYSIKALVSMEQLLETTMNEDLFAKVSCPVLSLYYYKDEENQDQVVDVSVIPWVHENLGTEKSKNKYKALPTPGNHVIASYIQSRDFQIVEDEIRAFCINTLGMSPAMH